MDVFHSQHNRLRLLRHHLDALQPIAVYLLASIIAPHVVNLISVTRAKGWDESICYRVIAALLGILGPHEFYISTDPKMLEVTDTVRAITLY